MMQIVNKIIPHAALQKMRHRLIKDDTKTLVYIHIGKCGGASLWDVINESKLVQEEFSQVHKVHTVKPPILENAKYLIVIRNPISRAISAFNWRYKLVVEDEVQRHRFKGEREILERYKTLNNLAESLYTDNEVNGEVAKEFQKIHHLKENIQFYLSELLDTITEEQIFGVLSTETLGEDVFQQLGVTNMKRTHENAKFVDESKKYLSASAYDNLKKYLGEDYESLRKLIELKTLTVCETNRLLK